MKYLLTALIAISSAASVFAENKISENQVPFIEKYKKQKMIIPPEEALINTDAEPSLEDGFVSLYNGENLDGWVVRGGYCTYEASGDSIIGTTIEGSPSSYLVTEREDFEDFVFTAEIKWEVDGNSGVMFRSMSKPDGEYERVMGPQVEMEGFEAHGGKRGWSGAIFGQGYGGWIYPLWLDAHEEVRGALIEGEWNRVTVKATGKTVKTWVNGVPAAHWVDDRYMKGFFGLQVHSGKKGRVLFRNIKVKELSSDADFSDLFESGDFSDWTRFDGQPVSPGWSINNGIVHLSEKKAGDIVTKKKYTDFELRFDWKISEGGNSGVKYRARGRLGLEYQILDDKKHPDRHDPTHRAGALYEMAEAKDGKPINPPGQWNSARIIAKGDSIEHWLNGEKILQITYGGEEWKQRFKKSKYKQHEGFGSWTGHILLQDHDDKVWFRNVRIREM